MTGDFAAIAFAFYAAHHAGDYWVQTDYDARTKGLPGWVGRKACLSHVTSYLATQLFCVFILWLVTGVSIRGIGLTVALVVSGITHYIADRREPLRRIVSSDLFPGKVAFWNLGTPRKGMVVVNYDGDSTLECVPVDNPSLGTGAWALDQAWHIFFGVFVAALIAVGV
jgi:hypothetical protein